MTKMRVHELAKELNITNNQIKDLLARRGIAIKSHMSAVDDEMIAIVKKVYGKEPEKSETKPATNAETKQQEPKTKESQLKDLQTKEPQKEKAVFKSDKKKRSSGFRGTRENQTGEK